ncbi:MerR family transcriptional regulator [Brevibacillus sp. MER 51]|uniref:MerR family transcriptional regulator n=1 Tax=Brevibacillus sp. MER 51 TaxID=2939560 RepID=UPI00203ED6E9|nr:MerR family transcriptional regulator [Brevibacillus sp. MER 51]MCM3144930.1 MerR family transcriptional regulator [Brevibacillus sp. MER 51]
MNIKEVAERTGLSAHTIRFYERSGLFPKIKRSKNGIREFSDSDVNFLIFMATLKKTGMSLEDISEFTKDGCILERLEAGEMPKEPVRNRLSILMDHRNKLLEQQRNIELFINAVTQKISFYGSYIEGTDNKEAEDFKDGRNKV